MANIVEKTKQSGDMSESEQPKQTNHEFGDERHYWAMNGKPLCNDDAGEIFEILNRMSEKFGVVFEGRSESAVKFANKFGGFMNIRIVFEVDCQRRDPDELRYECGL